MSKLYRIWESDGNDRNEYAKVKANDSEQVIQWLQETYFKPEALQELDIDDGVIFWNDCDKEECAKLNNVPIESEDFEVMCDSCETSQHSLSIEEIENPTPEDFEYKTIYGTNDFYDLTQDTPVKAEDWNKKLAETWKANPQKGCDLLLKLTLDSLAKNKKLTDMEQ
jgi:hypothetical protein